MAAVVIILAAAVYIRNGSFMEHKTTSSEDKLAVSALVHGYYYKYMQAVNNDIGWNELISDYTTSSASLVVAVDEKKFTSTSTSRGQYWISSSAPIALRIFSYSPAKAEILADGEYQISAVGYPPSNTRVRQLLILEKVNGRWYITDISDRTDKFNTFIDHNFASYERI